MMKSKHSGVISLFSYSKYELEVMLDLLCWREKP